MLANAKTVCVVIPTYKSFEALSIEELASIRQCLVILSKFAICFVGPDNLDFTSYIDTAKEHNNNVLIKKYNLMYFKDIIGYNKLMLSIEFYASFSDFKYILIYQTDSWVFNDNLDEWCLQSFDYIGAPIFTNFGTHEDGEKMEVVGNGGLSLRKTQKMIDVLSYKKRVLGWKPLYNEYKLDKGLKSFVRLCLKLTGFHNNVRYFLDFFLRKGINEDIFFSYHFPSDAKISIKVPNLQTAIKFSFDKSPAYLYELNGNDLPFGCHGWSREDNVYNTEGKKFWRKFINT